MENKCSPWVLCPSKKFPGQYYYFNTKTGEKAWSWTVPSEGQTQVASTAEKPQPQVSFGQVEFPKYIDNHAINPRTNYAPPSNINTPNVIGTGPNFMPRSRESEKQVSTTTHTNFKLAPAHFKAIPNNPFSLRLPEPLKKDSKQLCEGNASKTSVFEPVFTNIFLPKRRLSTDIEELNQAMKRAKICSTPSEKDTPDWNSDEVKYHVNCDDDASSIMTQYAANLRHFRSQNVKVCINFLRNLSMSENTDTWYLVPDLEVLLENLKFIRKFIAGDRTCLLLTPAAVLAKLQALRDDCRAGSHATVAGQVIQWLTENSACQNDNFDYCALDELTIQREIVQQCKKVNVFHVVIITKSKSLYDQAKRNDIHVYYLKALKIINQTENLFLLDPNNNNTFEWPITTPDNVFNRKENKNKNSKNDVRVSATNDSTLNTTEGSFVERKLREFCTKHAHLHANIIERVDECTCSFLQIMEHCLHNVLQCIPDTQFDPPCWFDEGLHLLKQVYYQHKQLCAILEHLISMCGFHINNGIIRPIVKSETFLKILGAGILMVEQLEEILEIPELGDSKDMLSNLIVNIQTAEEFPAVVSISPECRRLLGDEPFRMEGVNDTENDRFASERALQHEVINTASNREALHQNQSTPNSNTLHQIFDVQGCGGSIQLFRDGNISKQNHFDSNQDKTIHWIDSGNTIHQISSAYQSINSTSSVIAQRIDSGGPVFQKLENTVDMIRYALTKLKLFIEGRIEELKKGAIPKRRKEYLREKSIRLIDYAAGMLQTLKIIQKRENPSDPSFGKKFAVQNPAYTECIENCLEQVENMHRSFIYLLKALK